MDDTNLLKKIFQYESLSRIFAIAFITSVISLGVYEVLLFFYPHQMNLPAFEQETVAAERYTSNLGNVQAAARQRIEIEQKKSSLLKQKLELEHSSAELHQHALAEIEKKIDAEKSCHQEAAQRLMIEQALAQQSVTHVVLQQAARLMEQENLEREQGLTALTAELMSAQQALKDQLLQQISEKEQTIAIECARVLAEQLLSKTLQQQQSQENLLYAQILESQDQAEKANRLLQQRIQMEAEAIATSKQSAEHEQNILYSLQNLQQQYQRQLLQNQESNDANQQQLLQEYAHAETLAKQLIDKMLQQQMQNNDWCRQARKVLQESPVNLELPEVVRPLISFRLRNTVLAGLLLCVGIGGISSWQTIYAGSITSTNAVVTPLAKFQSKGSVSANTMSTPAITSDKFIKLQMAYELSPVVTAPAVSE